MRRADPSWHGVRLRPRDRLGCGLRAGAAVQDTAGRMVPAGLERAVKTGPVRQHDQPGHVAVQGDRNAAGRSDHGCHDGLRTWQVEGHEVVGGQHGAEVRIVAAAGRPLA